MSRQANVLFDVPGPRARRLNLVVGVVGVLAIAALLVWAVWRLKDTGQFSSQKWDPFQYTGIQQTIVDGLEATLKAFALAAVFSLVLGALLAAGRLSDHAPVRWAASVFVTFFRAMPLVVLIFFLYVGPSSGHWWHWDPMWPLVLGLTLYNGTVQSETMRAGILAVPRGQSEAAFALGLRKHQVMRMILVPQSVRAMLPNIISQLVVTLKDTSLGFLITYPELLHAGQLIARKQDYGLPYIPVAIVIGVVYVGICMLLSGLAHLVERGSRTAGRGGRRPTVRARGTATPMPDATVSGG